MFARRLAPLLLVAVLTAVALLAGRDDGRAGPARAAAPASSLLRPGVSVRPVAVPAPRREARGALKRLLGARGVLSVDRRTGGVRAAGRLDGTLTGPRRGAPEAAVLAYVARHEEAFGLDADDRAGLRLVGRERTRRMTHLRWRQSVAGVPLHDADLRASVTADGRVVSIGGGAVPDAAEQLPDPRIGVRLDAAGARRAARRATGGALGRIEATRLVLTSATGALRPAWHVVRRRSPLSVLDQLVDARTGAELQRFDRVRHATATAFDHWPDAPVGGAQRTIDITGWLDPGADGLAGPYAHVFADTDGDDQADPGERIAPGADGNWNVARTGFAGPGCPLAGCSWDRTAAGSWRTNLRQAGTQMFASLHDFRAHLASAPIGFDDFTGDERVNAHVLHGADGPGGLPSALNNASMFTPPTGSPDLYSFLWGSTRTPALNSADDASVTWHEYSHGMNARSVVDAQGWSRLNVRQAYAMDEGLADFWALDRLAERGAIPDTAAPGEVQVGKHVDPRGEGRSMPTDCPVDELELVCLRADLRPGGYTYADMGRVGPEPEPHLDGEILTQTMWELRDRLKADLGAGPGLTRLRELLAGATHALPAEPSFLDLRNALLQQDAALHGARSAAGIWAVFAGRGMGWRASTRDGDAVDVVADDTLPPAAPGLALTGVVTDRATGEPIAGARVALGGHDTSADGNGVADRAATTDAEGRYRIADVGTGSYATLLVRAPGYEDGELADVAAGSDRPVSLRRNWADARAGATLQSSTGPNYTAYDCGPGEALDGDRTTGWLTSRRTDTPSVTVLLPRAVRLTSVGVDPTPRSKQYCGGTAPMLPAEVRVEVSPSASPSGEWSEVVRSELEPGRERAVTELRPAAPLDGVRRVRLTLVRPQSGDDLALSELQVFAAGGRAPQAAFDVAPLTPAVDQEVVLDAAATRPGSAPVARHEWDLDGDGRHERDGGASATTETAFTKAGVHRVGLRVTDAAGETDESRRTVVVGTDVEISDLGTLTAGAAATSRALGVNDRLDVVGSSDAGADLRAFRYRGGAMAELAALPGHTFSSATNVGPAGHAVGLSAPQRANGGRRAVRWAPDGTPTDLGTLGGAQAGARDVDASGTAVGWAQDASGRRAAFIHAAAGPMRDIEVLGGVPFAKRRGGLATRISAAGVVTGCLESDGQNCSGPAFRFDRATNALVELPGLGGTSSSGVAIDGAGAVGGWSKDATGALRPVRWSPAGVLEPLGTLGGRDGAVVSMNDDGLSVGVADDGEGRSRAVRWVGTRARDLNDLVAGRGWSLESAQTVNERGEVVGWGRKDGVERAWMMNLGACRVCVRSVRFEQTDVPSGAWRPVGPDGVTEGSVVRAVVRVANADPDATHLVRVEGREDARGLDLPPSATVALAPGEADDLFVDVATEGSAWTDAGRAVTERILRFTATQGRTRFSSRGVALEVRPRPVVLVHGQLAGPDDFAALGASLRRAHAGWPVFAVGDGQVPGALGGATFGDLDAAPATIRQNATALDRYVEGVRAETEAQRVDVVAHEAGGLVARRWIHDRVPAPAPGDPPRVAHLVQLGTPNQGTPCAELLDLDEWVELRRDMAASFNREVTDRKGVPFSALAGDAESATCQDGEDGDGLVAASSAEWRVADRKRTALRSEELTGSGSAFSAWLLPRLNGTRSVPVEPAALRAAAAAPETDDEGVERSHQLLAERRAALAPGGTAEVPFDVDGGAALAVDLLAPRDVTARLIGPDGGVADTAPGRGLVRTLRAESPVAGRWTLRLDHAGDDAVEVAAAARVADDPWDLDLRVGRAAAGGTTPLVAAVGRGARRVPGAAVTVGVRRRGEAERAVTLLDDGAHGDGAAGDGCYGATAELPAGPALATLRVRGGAAERLRRTLVDVAAASGAGEAVRCLPPAGRNGEVAFSVRDRATGATAWWLARDGAEERFGRIADRAKEAVYSPDGTRVAWTVLDEVLVADVAGGEPTRVAGGDGVSRTEVAWAPGGDRVAYAIGCRVGPERPSREAGCGIAIADVATRREEELLAGGAPLGGDEPTWSARGDRIGFVALDAADVPELFTVRLDGSGRRQLTRGSIGLSHPAWSPRGDRIAFTRFEVWSSEVQAEGDRDVYLVDADGTGLQRVTDDGTCDPDVAACRADDDDAMPAWSPDGRKLAYVSTRGEPVDRGQGIPLTSQVWETRPDGQGARALTASPTRKDAPTWRALAFLLDAAAPSCDAVRTSVRTGGTVRVALSCGDANGDDLALRIVSPPARGSLSAIAADGSVRFTAPGDTGTVTFTYTASDATADAPPATVTVDVESPPPPDPPQGEDGPTTPGTPGGGPGGGWPGGGGVVIGGGSGGRGSGGSGGSGSGGAGSGGSGGGGTSPIPPGCTYNPVSQTCGIPVGCPRGGSLDNCVGRVFQAPAGRVRAALLAPPPKLPAMPKLTPATLLRPFSVRIPAGQTRTARVRLTRRGAQLIRRKGRLAVRVRREIVVGGRVVRRETRTVTFRMAKARRR